MSDLSDFLLARIAEQERAILDGWDSDGKARVASMWTGGEPGFTTVASDHADGHWVAAGREVEDPRHIQVLWDPARVLAECQAKRRIVDWHRLISGVDSWDKPVLGCGNCCACGTEGEYLIEGPCLTIRLLALPYADHPSYDPAWRA